MFLSGVVISSYLELNTSIIIFSICVTVPVALNYFTDHFGKSRASKNGLFIFVSIVVFAITAAKPFIYMYIDSEAMFGVTEIIEIALCYGYYLICLLLYKFIFVNCKYIIISLISLLFCLLESRSNSRISILCVIMIVCIFLTFLFGNFGVKRFDLKINIGVVIVVTISLILSELFMFIIESINIQQVIIDTRNYVEENILHISRFDEDLLKIYLYPRGEFLSDNIIFTVDTNRRIDRVKSFSASYFNTDENCFEVDPNYNDNNNDFSPLFLTPNGAETVNDMHITVTNNRSRIVYVPYGILNFQSNTTMYKDQVVIYDNNDNNREYTLTYSQNIYDNESNKPDPQLLAEYQSFAEENYGYKPGSDNIPTPIVNAIESYLENNPTLRSYISNSIKENGELDDRYIHRADDYINDHFTIAESYERNVEGLDDITYALQYNYEVNSELLAAIKMFIFRYFNIPSRFVVGYNIREYTSDTAIIKESDRVYFPEVYTTGFWIPSDNMFLSSTSQIGGDDEKAAREDENTENENEEEVSEDENKEDELDKEKVNEEDNSDTKADVNEDENADGEDNSDESDQESEEGSEENNDDNNSENQDENSSDDNNDENEDENTDEDSEDQSDELNNELGDQSGSENESDNSDQNNNENNDGDSQNNNENNYNQQTQTEQDDQIQNNSSNLVLISSLVGSLLIALIVYIILRRRYYKRLREMGIETKEQLKLLKAINANYKKLDKNHYLTTQINDIMLRIRFSLHRETQQDLVVLKNQVAYMKQDMKKRKKSSRI